jgi:phosphate transport system substrate-binding protein
VKKAHLGVIPGLKEFVAEYVSEKAIGSDGYLADKGLIPPGDSERGKIRADAIALRTVKL